MTFELFTGKAEALKAHLDALSFTTLHSVNKTHEKGVYLIIYTP